MQAVRRASAPYRSAEEARQGVARAAIVFAMAELPAALALAGLLYWLFAAENGLDEPTRTTWLVAGMLAFVLYVGVLFFTILLPALRRKRAFDQGDR